MNWGYMSRKIVGIGGEGVGQTNREGVGGRPIGREGVADQYSIFVLECIQHQRTAAVLYYSQ